MTPDRRWTLSLFAAGALLLALGAWLLHATLPARPLPAGEPRGNGRKMVRIAPAVRPPPGRDQKRSDNGREPLALAHAGMVHGLADRNAAG